MEVRLATMFGPYLCLFRRKMIGFTNLRRCIRGRGEDLDRKPVEGELRTDLRPTLVSLAKLNVMFLVKMYYLTL